MGLNKLISAGLTKVSLRSYLFGCLGIVPGTLAFVYIGASTAGTMNERVSTFTHVLQSTKGGGTQHYPYIIRMDMRRGKVWGYGVIVYYSIRVRIPMCCNRRRGCVRLPAYMILMFNVHKYERACPCVAMDERGYVTLRVFRRSVCTHTLSH